MRRGVVLVGTGRDAVVGMRWVGKLEGGGHRSVARKLSTSGARGGTVGVRRVGGTKFSGITTSRFEAKKWRANEPHSPSPHGGAPGLRA